MIGLGSDKNHNHVPCHPGHQAADAVPPLSRRRRRLFTCFHPRQFLIQDLSCDVRDVPPKQSVLSTKRFIYGRF